jgi:hypothetical protein
MARKWITITFADGSFQTTSLDESHNVTIEFKQAMTVAKVVVSDQPESPLINLLAQELDRDS